MTGRLIRIVLISIPEFCILAVLWMLLVSQMKLTEFWLGLAVALVASVADAVVKSQRLVDFLPHPGWLSLIFLEPWYAIEGTWEILLALAERIAGKPSQAILKVIEFSPGGDDKASQARRAIAITYFTIPPNFVVLGIDRDRGLMLVHQVSASGVPFIAKRLGAKE